MKKSEFKALIKEELSNLQELDLTAAVPEDTSYTEFAKAIAQMIKDEYGSHNIEPFMKALHAELGLNEAEDSGPMTPEEEKMIDDYEEREANKYALDKEEPLEEVLKRVDAIVEAWNSKKKLTEEVHGGYLELFEMDPNFEKAIELLDQAWEQWKNGPSTEAEDIQMAREDILEYLSNMLK